MRKIEGRELERMLQQGQLEEFLEVMREPFDPLDIAHMIIVSLLPLTSLAIGILLHLARLWDL